MMNLKIFFRLHFAASLRFLKASLPKVRSLILEKAGHWHRKCSIVSLSSSLQFMQLSFWVRPNLKACMPIRQCPVYKPVNALHWARLSDNNELDFLGLKGPHMVLAILFPLAVNHSLFASFIILSLRDFLTFWIGWCISSDICKLRLAPSLASESAASLPAIPRCPGTQQSVTLLLVQRAVRV